MTVPRTFRPRAWSTAAAAAFVAGLASTTGMAAAQHAALLAAAASDEPAGPAPATMVPSMAASPRAARSTRATGTIGLRPDPANPNQLVVDFGAAPA